MSTQAIQAGEAFIQLSIRGEELQKSLNQLGTKLDEFGSKTASSLSTLRGALSGLIDDCGYLGDSISMAGISITGLSLTLGSFSKISESFKTAAKMTAKFNEEQLKRIVTDKLSLKITGKGVVSQKLLSVNTWLSIKSIHAMSLAQKILNASIYGCPITWIVGGLAALGAAVGGVMYLV